MMRLMRTLSHYETANILAEPYKKLCENGDAILINYFKSSTTDTITYSYIQLDENGEWKTYINEYRFGEEFTPFWKYDSCLYKFNENIEI